MALPRIITPGATPTSGDYGSGGIEGPRHEKDPDAIKLFVGQVPKNFDEKDLKPYLDPYGSIHELTILRDKLNMSHKGIFALSSSGSCVVVVISIYQGLAIKG